MPGMWSADPGFLREAGLSDMQLYIAPERRGYIIMTDDNGEFLVNKPIEMSYSFAASNTLKPLRKCWSGVVTIEVEGGSSAIPREMQMELDTAAGSLSLSSEGKLFALLYKDLLASHASALAWKD